MKVIGICQLCKMHIEAKLDEIDTQIKEINSESMLYQVEKDLLEYTQRWVKRELLNQK